MHETEATTIVSRRVSSADGGGVAQAVDLVVHRRVLLDVGVARRDVGLGLVVVVVGDEVLDPVLREELPHLVGQLGGERLVGGDDQRGPLGLLDRPGDGGGLARPGDAEEGLEAVAPLDALGQRGDGLGLVAGRLEVGDDLERGARGGVGASRSRVYEGGATANPRRRRPGGRPARSTASSTWALRSSREPAVVDDPVGDGPPVLPGDLGGDPGPGVVLARTPGTPPAAPPPRRPGSRRRSPPPPGRRPCRPAPPAAGCPARRRCRSTPAPPSGSPSPARPAGGSCRSGRLERLGVAEHDAASAGRSSVPSAATMPVAEALDHRHERLAARRLQLPDDGVGVDDHRAPRHRAAPRPSTCPIRSRRSVPRAARARNVPSHASTPRPTAPRPGPAHRTAPAAPAAGRPARPLRPAGHRRPLGDVAVGLALAALQEDGTDRAGYLALGVPARRLRRPPHRPPAALPHRPQATSGLVDVLAEVALSLAVVVATDYWSSPYVFCLASAILAAGFARGFGFAIRTALHRHRRRRHPLPPADRRRRRSARPSSGAASSSSSPSSPATPAGSSARPRSSAPSPRQANDLLTQLNAVAQTLPASLDLGETVDATIAELRDLFPIDVVAVLLWEDASDSWTVAAAEGVRLPVVVTTPTLPAAARDALIAQRPTRTADDHPTDRRPRRRRRARRHLPPAARPRPPRRPHRHREPHRGRRRPHRPPARPRRRRRRPGRPRPRQRPLVPAPPHRRRRRGAHPHRPRPPRPRRPEPRLRRLRARPHQPPRRQRLARRRPSSSSSATEVRNVVTEVRDTLYDLRTDVIRPQGPRGHPRRVPRPPPGPPRRRSTSASTSSPTAACPLRQEREIWRIAQEAVTNALRHADSTIIRVTWLERHRTVRCAAAFVESPHHERSTT